MSTVPTFSVASKEDTRPLRERWEEFVEGKLLNFAETHGIEKLNVDNGLGCKAKLQRDKNGNWVKEVTVKEPIE